MKNTEGTASLEKALDILEAIGGAPSGLSQAELIDRVPLPKTTLYRIVGTLVERGILRRDTPHRVYRLGFRYLEMVRNAYLKPDLVAAASSELRALRDLTGETSYLAVLDGTEVRSLERCDGAHTARSAAALGRSKPLYCTGQGKAILSVLADSERDPILKALVFEPLTVNTLTDRRQLLLELKTTLARGFAIDDEEIVIGVRCVAAPIVDLQGKVRGALSVAGPAYRLSRERLMLLGPELAEAARRVGAELRTSQASAADSQVRVVSQSWAFEGRFPRWSASDQTLYWADTLAPTIHALQGGHERVVARLDSPILGLERHPEGLLVCHQTGWSLIDQQGLERPLGDWPGKPLLAMTISPQGHLWGCLATRSGCILGPLSNGEVKEARSFGEPLGAFGWSSDGTLLYTAGIQSGAIYIVQPQQTTVRRLASLPKGAGKLGGVAVDAQGNIWASLIDGWSLVQFNPDGTLEQMLGMPVPCPTDLVFTDDNRLFVTTSRRDVSRDSLQNAPASGQVLELDLNAVKSHTVGI